MVYFFVYSQDFLSITQYIVYGRRCGFSAVLSNIIISKMLENEDDATAICDSAVLITIY